MSTVTEPSLPENNAFERPIQSGIVLVGSLKAVA